MGIKSWIASKMTLEMKSNPYSDDSFFNSQASRNLIAGVDVNYTTAMQHQDVYTCVRIKAESVGQLPINLYRVKDTVKYKITSGREYNIFTQSPNSYQTWQEFIEMYCTAMELRGNFYAEVKRNRYGNVYEIVPFKSQMGVSVNMDSNGRVYYTYSTNDSKSGQSVRNYTNNNILHIKMNSTDGFRGMSPITHTAKSIGAAIAGEDHANSLFKNGARPSGILSTTEAFGDDEEAVQRLRTQWEDMHSGSDNTGKTAVLEYGMQYSPITMTAVDAQLLEQRKLSREQIASIFRVPLHMLNAASAMKYNTIEQNNTGFFRDALMPLITKLENNINPLLPDNHVIKIDEKQFVRGDRKTQTDNVTAEIKSGLCSINEGRTELGREPIDGGDVFAVATNNLHFGKWEDLEKIQQSMSKGPAKDTELDSTSDPNESNDPDEPSNTNENEETDG